MNRPEDRETEWMPKHSAVVPASQPGGSSIGGIGSTAMPPEMAAKAAERLHWLALICAAAVVQILLVQIWLQPELHKNGMPALQLESAAAVVVYALGVFAAYRFGKAQPGTMIWLGFGLQILCSVAIGLLENALPKAADQAILGTSRLSAWILISSLIMTNVPWKSLLTILACLATGPLTHFFCAWYVGYQPLPWNRLSAFYFFSLVTSVFAYLTILRTYRVERELSKVKALGSYRLESLIGRGGMGEVWRAKHHYLAREAAVKLMSSETLKNLTLSDWSGLQKRFEREAQATASLRSPHTIVLFDYGVSRDGTFYYVMELLEGLDLDTLIDKHGPQPAARVVHLMIQACESLAEAHSLGMVHRDIKPSNLFICRMGVRYDHVKVLDFGLVGGVNTAGESRLTTAGMTTGTPLFMSPEQAMGQELDARSDLYSLACVAYSLLTGQMVFDAGTPMGVALSHVQQTPVPPSQRCELPIPRDLEEVIMRCLAKDKAHRPGSAEELSALLSACASSKEWSNTQARDWWKLHRA